jgi:hypothetical protein
MTTKEGNPLQCDAENGGPDRKAYLLVPAPLLPTVQPILQQYLNSIRPISYNTNSGLTNDRPDRNLRTDCIRPTKHKLSPTHVIS